MAEVESQCRSCQAPIFWAVTEASVVAGDPKRMPVDYHPDPVKGNVAIVARTSGDAPVVRVYSQAPLMPPEGGLYLSHYVNCEQANQWRK